MTLSVVEPLLLTAPLYSPELPNGYRAARAGNKHSRDDKGEEVEVIEEENEEAAQDDGQNQREDGGDGFSDGGNNASQRVSCVGSFGFINTCHSTRNSTHHQSDLILTHSRLAGKR